MKHDDNTYRERYLHRCQVIATCSAIAFLALAALLLICAAGPS